MGACSVSCREVSAPTKHSVAAANVMVITRQTSDLRDDGLDITPAERQRNMDVMCKGANHA